MTREEVVSGLLDIFESDLRIEVPGPTVDLIDTGYLDSLGLVRLLAEMEGRFDITLDLNELELTDLGTVDSLADVVMRLV